MFEKKSVIITGAGSGIGRATAIEFASQGAQVIVSDISEVNGKNVVNEIYEDGGAAIFHKADVSQRAEVNNLVEFCIEKYGKLDIIINNAGIGGELCFFEQITDEDWDKIIAVNQTGVFYCMQAALKQMKNQKNGRIVNVSSLAGIGAAPRMGAYAASKHAVVGMTKSAAVEYGKYNIRINAVCPTVIKTPMGDAYASSNQHVIEMIKSTIPMKRFGEAQEVAKTITWLCSEESSFINGETIRVDGGMNA